MVTPSRWGRAQEYEAGYWTRQAADIAAGTASQLEWYGWRADQLAQALRDAGLGNLSAGDASVVEVGSGPVGVASFFPARVRVAVDPLERVYAANPVLTAHRSPDVDYRQGRGEALPCDDGAFDLAIIENCIDHVQDMHGVMRELRRVLRPGGTLYLTVNCRSAKGYWVHRVLSRLRLDPGHPHTFTPARVGRLVEDHGFRPLRTWELQSHGEARRADLASSSRKDRLKGYLDVSEFAVAVIAERADLPEPSRRPDGSRPESHR
jgi:SAM-dependent methyltransferase